MRCNIGFNHASLIEFGLDYAFIEINFEVVLQDQIYFVYQYFKLNLFINISTSTQAYFQIETKLNMSLINQLNNAKSS